jgi:hypothetical protein
MATTIHRRNRLLRPSARAPEVPKKMARKPQACQYLVVPAGKKKQNPLQSLETLSRARLLYLDCSSHRIPPSQHAPYLATATARPSAPAGLADQLPRISAAARQCKALSHLPVFCAKLQADRLALFKTNYKRRMADKAWSHRLSTCHKLIGSNDYSCCQGFLRDEF